MPEALEVLRTSMPSATPEAPSSSSAPSCSPRANRTTHRPSRGPAAMAPRGGGLNLGPAMLHHGGAMQS